MAGWGKHYRTGEALALPASASFDKGVDREVYVFPGLVDLQVNGYAGVDFNQDALSTEELEAALKALAAQGVVACLPTLITNDPSFLTQRIEFLARFQREHPLGFLIAGIHLEGPFLSSVDGPRGAHPKAFIHRPCGELLKSWIDASCGLLRILTLAPEGDGALELIRQAAAAGIQVGIGHTAASPQLIASAVQEGARLVTHFGNGCHAVLPRHPNYLWEELAQDDLWVSLIADGFHLPEQVLKVAVKVKGPRAFWISDSVGLAGLEPGNYGTLIGGEVTLTPEGRLHLKDDPKLLAGSAQSLLQGVHNIAAAEICSFTDSWDRGSLVPRQFLGEENSETFHPDIHGMVLRSSSQEDGQVLGVYWGEQRLA